MNRTLRLLVLAAVASAPTALAVEAPAPGATAIFTDETEASGLDFAHFNGMSGELYLLENTGSGAALFDYDGDGDLDAYLVQGHMLGPGKDLEQATFPPRYPLPLSDRLYRNDLTVHPDGSRTVRFTDVTEESGIARVASGYGIGVAAGDFDNDGWTDLYVANYGSNHLLRNRGPGPEGTVTFEDVTAAAGADDARWSIGASFVDFDRDGWLDLYVVNYVDFEFARHRKCNTVSGAPDYCSPLAYEPEADRLLRNRGPGPDGRVSFEDVSERMGLAEKKGNGLGVVATDVDGDGWSDLYVANDQMPNFLWLNREGRSFQEDAVLSGTAVNRAGKPEASMGVLAADFDGDGDDDLFMAHLTGESNTFYRNDGGGLFVDDTAKTGLGPASMEATGFGAGALDYDNDGRLDLFVANGAVQVIEALAREGDPYPLDQANQLFRNLDGKRFEEVTGRAGPALELAEVSRGLAVGDVDDDGDPDVLVANNAGPARLLVNRVGQDRAWLGLRLVGAAGGRDMLGARAAVYREGAPPLWRRARTDGSYASSGDPRVLFGLGDPAEAPAKVRKVRVVWPDGTEEEWKDVPTGRYSTLRQGSGRRVP